VPETYEEIEEVKRRDEVMRENAARGGFRNLWG